MASDSDSPDSSAEEPDLPDGNPSARAPEQFSTARPISETWDLPSCELDLADQGTFSLSPLINSPYNASGSREGSVVGQQPGSAGAPVPRSFGRYQLHRLVRTGAWTEVWQGVDSLLRRAVAVTIVRPDRPLSAELQQQLLLGAQRVARLNLHGVVPVHDVGEDQGGVYIVSEFIHGDTLADLLRRRPPTPLQAARLMAAVAETLHQAHVRDMVHWNIQPSNILIDQRGTIWVADFGLAVSAVQPLDELDGSPGWPAYRSPEQASGDRQRLDARSDIYSLGVILYQLLTGRLPFEPRSFSEYRDEGVEVEPPLPRTLVGSVPPELERICLKCLARSAADRYATAAELAIELRRWVAVTAPAMRLTDRLRGGAGWLAGAAGLLLAAGLSVSGWWYASPERNEPPMPEGPSRIAAGQAASDAVPPTAVATVDGDAELLAAWQARLGRSPEDLIWPGYRGSGSHGFRGDLQAYELTCDAPRLIGLGELDGQPCSLSVGISRPTLWQGDVGLFLGYREFEHQGRHRACFQAITMGQDRHGQLQLKLQRRRLILSDTAAPLVPEKELGTQTLPWSTVQQQSPVRLELELGPDGLQRLRAGSEPLVDLLGPLIEQHLTPEDYQGPWGLFSQAGTTWFHDPAITPGAAP